MLSLEWPYVLALVPLPWLVRRLLPALDRAGGAALRVPDAGDFGISAEPGRRVHLQARWPTLLAFVGWALLVLAAARPQWVGEAIEVPITGRDLMLAVDLSESMRQTDFLIGRDAVDRLTATKAVAADFITRRVGDRLGLILFGTQAYLHVPLTFDRETVRKLLFESAIGFAGRNTAIGDAIGLAVKRLREQESEHKVLVLMTDGANTAGVIEPLRAAELAADAGLTIHTIGIGADAMMVERMFGTIRVDPSQDLDEETLRGIAEMTGGRYFRARDTEEFEAIYSELDRLEPIDQGGEYYRPREPLFMWPLAAGLCVAGVLAWNREASSG